MVANLKEEHFADLPARHRFVADRFRRIWHIVEVIAAEPGHTRRELAERFHLSDRQVQADLNLISQKLRLPLRRDRGYRFGGPGERPGPTHLALTDALTLLTIVTQARGPRSPLTLHLDALAARLPLMFPLHLQPIVRYALRSSVAAALVAAILNETPVKLRYPRAAMPAPLSGYESPTITPLLLIPYLASWFLIGSCEQLKRTVMVNIDAVSAVTTEPSK